MKKGLYSTGGLLAKTIDVLDVMSGLDGPARISEIACKSNVHVSTAYRIASELVKHGYLRQEGRRGKYAIGWKFLKFSHLVQNNFEIREVALPYLKELRTVTGESVNLAVLDENEVIYVDHIESDHMLRAFTAVGNRAPLYCTGVGKILWAFMEKDRFETVLNQPRNKITKNTLVNKKSLVTELAAIRRHGIAIDNGEMDEEVRCIAAPIFDSEGVVAAAISLSGPFSRLPGDKINQLKPVVKKYGLDISKVMGYRALQEK